MKLPTLQEEIKLWKQGYKKVAGIDEVGRGPLAGPVVACAFVIIARTFLRRRSVLRNIKDSKQLSGDQREKFYKILTEDSDIEWGIGMVSEKVIDKINILEATKLAMQKAVKKLKKPDFLILDGNFSIKSDIPQKSIIKGDEKVFSCSCASIIAKVMRDRLMLKYDKKYPHYDFAGNKGYPTKQHRAMLRKYGRCDIHRNSFHYAST
ncbi:MAG: ribonuclease HII [Candidatus Nealsonbacteria bacterium]